MENAINFIDRDAFVKELNKRICAQYDENTSSRTKVYFAEVALVKELISAMSGINLDVDDDTIHDFACDFVDAVHSKFDK